MLGKSQSQYFYLLDFSEKLQYGNHSIEGQTWIGGPTETMKAQHIPGYDGYVPQIKSENLFGKNFAKTTAKAINGDYKKGIQPTIKEQFTTEQK